MSWLPHNKLIDLEELDLTADEKIEFRLLLTSGAAEKIAGKHEGHLKNWSTQFNTKIQIPRSYKPERICKVFSNPATILSFVRKIIPYLDQFQFLDVNADCELRLLIHRFHVKKLTQFEWYGKSKIDKMKEVYNTNVKIFPESAPLSNEHVLLISGDVEDCLSSLEYLLKKLLKVPLKGEKKNYVASNHNPKKINKYGGFAGSPEKVPTFVTMLPEFIKWFEDEAAEERFYCVTCAIDNPKFFKCAPDRENCLMRTSDDWWSKFKSFFSRNSHSHEASQE